MKKRILATVMALAMMLSMAACGSNGSSSAAGTDGAADATVSAETVNREDIIIGITGEPTSLDPKDANDLNTFSIQSNLYDGLVRIEADGTLTPALAESWEYNEDNTEITFKLREGVKFHNGDTMTADDVVFSFNRAIEASTTKRITGSMEKMEKVDDTHVKLTLKYAYGVIEGCLGMVNCSIVSQAAYEANPDGFSRNPVGTGPYKLINWASGTSIEMEAHEEYWREPASIKKVTYQLIGDSSSALIALQTGDVDLLPTTMASDRNNIMSDTNLTYSEQSSSSFYMVAMNNTEGLFADNPKLREAVSYAVDPETVLLGAMDGIGTVATCPIPNSCVGFPEEFEGTTYDPEKAKELLAEAGYPDGLTVTLKVGDRGYYPKVADVVADQLSQVGINCEVEQMEWTAFLSDVYTNCEYEICVNSYTALYPDADFIMYMRYHSDHLGGGNNFVMVSNPELDTLLETGRFSNDQAERDQAYLDACQLMKDESVLVPLIIPYNSTACNKSLKGHAANASQKVYVYDLYWE